MSKIKRFYNGRLVRDHQLKQEELWIKDGKIILPQPHADEEFDLQELIVAPGYIDLQINGGFGYDFSSHPQGVAVVASHLPQCGVTAFLPTVISSDPSVYQQILPVLRKFIENTSGSAVLGIHLEGPFFCAEQKGVHDSDFIKSTQKVDLEDVYGSLEGVKIVTLAPELPRALSLISSLKEKGIVASMGHTNATYEEAEEAIHAGATLATHLFNAMAPLHHRKPGIVAAVLNQPHLFYSIIADYAHVHPAMLKLAWRAHPKGLILVSDAIEALGLSDGTYCLGKQTITVKNRKAYLTGTDTIAGSVLSLDEAVRLLHKATGCSKAEAIETASLRPAQVLGIQNRKGSLKIGSDADFILLDDELKVQSTYIQGEKVWPMI